MLTKAKSLFTKNFELLFWIAALVSLAFSNPDAAHYTLCPLKLMGFKWCPGCGLGHAISYLLHGQISRSFHAHWFGIPAFFVLIYRIISLIRSNYFSPIKFPGLPESARS